jgi:predicted TIM-barrel fold metal-dependent hydrolase
MMRTVGRFVLRRIAPVDAPHPIHTSLRVKTHAVDRPRFAVVDAHAHLRGTIGARWSSYSSEDLIDALDAAGIAATVALDGGYGEALAAEITRLQAPNPRRVAVFANINYGTLSQRTDFGAVEAERLVASVRAGARGLKIWKTLGLSIRDADNDLIGIDDVRLSPLWDAAADLRVPVLIHFADPAAFFEPLTFANERWLELQLHPDWHQYPSRKTGDRSDSRPPSFEELHEQFAALLRRHPATTFIGAHMASSAEDLARVGRLLEEHPNLYVDTSARLNELGRQPYTSRELLLRFQDRVLFGTDTGPDIEVCRLHYQYFETPAEYVPYGPSASPHQGNWRIYGVDLPDDALQKIYRENAMRLIGFDR